MALNLTEKGKVAFDLAYKHFPKGQFSAADLSDACGEKIVAATLNGIVNKGYMEKDNTASPVLFKFVDDIEFFLIADEAEDAGCDNSNLIKAKNVKNDEFYTQLESINAELINYRPYFKGKSIFCNCNDGLQSQFFQFFLASFDDFGITRLVGISYNPEGSGTKYEVSDDLNGDGFIDEEDIIVTQLEGNGGFQTPESIEELNKCDIVCTNPPFSVFREYIDQLMEYNKQFLVIGSKNAITYKEFFPLLKDNKVWIGITQPSDFIEPNGLATKKINGLARWFTNIPNKRQTEPMILTASYYDAKNRRENYPQYDNYNAIEVGKVVNIPSDYAGVMGVPITFLDKYCPEQFNILGHTASCDVSPAVEALRTDQNYRNRGRIDGKEKYDRILIQKK